MWAAYPASCLLSIVVDRKGAVGYSAGTLAHGARPFQKVNV
ncbi:hypothetical protein P7I00_gp02 [Pseudomonas phage UF_RH1]|uniref:Uncharacterized protein n=1 Tax=Pseudomonas phage UF_RH1 TaxID=3020045 RepID=A0AAE9XBK3_9CAUD|nr:hypothetical protein P7I00_gp02 [Pseudomonas phage UF_RH1]WCF59028.1 hypothetical protein UFRH1_2 [Pseudomonas phage UF_RH1]